MRNQLFCIVLLSIIAFSMALRIRKSHQEERIPGIIWNRDVARDNHCFEACTSAGGYSCAYTLSVRLKPRSSNDLYQCADSFEDCQNWLDNPFECQRAHCRPWEYSLNRQYGFVC